MKEILEHLFQHKTLSKQEAKTVLIDIASGKYNHYQIASFLTAFIMRNITLEELKGFREGLLELCHKIDLSAYNPMDVCGTGGDGKNTFNISTLSAFVVAACGVPVAKHGNYGVSSVSGSSNVLEFLGITFQTDAEKIKQQIESTNICFLHAPLFHPAMRHVGPVRKELGVKTFFNMLGPLVNPAQPKIQMAGVFSLELARMYQYLFQEENMQYSIVHGLNGFDEITLTDTCKLFSDQGEKMLTPSYFGFNYIQETELFGGDTVEEAAQIFMNVLNGNGTKAQNEVVIANSALAIKTYHQNISIEEAVNKANDALLSKRALEIFNRLKQLS
jgi:anthranilate phosphoribosyltransferase